MDEDGEELDEDDGKTRYLNGRAGDHLMVPFQCGLCHFRNIYGRNPVSFRVIDQEMLEYIRRATLDSFWAREPSTVQGNLKEAKRVFRFVDRMKIPNIVPPMGPFPLEDVHGMAIACAVLDRSLDKGLYEEFVQFDTFRRAKSALTNITQAGIGGLKDSVGAYERNKLWISESPVHSFWFNRFIVGIHRRVGDFRKQDEPITIEILHAVDQILEREWAYVKEDLKSHLNRAKRISEMGVWYNGGFCMSARGEEMPLIEFTGTAESLVHLGDKDEPFYYLVVTGRTKGVQLSGHKIRVPIVSVTGGTNIRGGRWIRRLVYLKHNMKEGRGRLFQRALNPPRLCEFEDDFYGLLEKVQEETELIKKELNVREDFGILRSLRKGATAHAKNMRVNEDDINSFNRWGSSIRRGGRLPRLDMINTYANWDALLPTLLRVTKAY